MATTPRGLIGVKVRGFGTFSIEVLQRGQTLLEGAAREDGTIEGQVASTVLEQKVIGADHPFMRSTPRISPLDEESAFRMVPMPEGSGCDEVEVLLAPDEPEPKKDRRTRRKDRTP
jgi:hypothetical protein